MSYSIELNALPRKARNELIEYYEFLLNKYSQRPDRETRNAR
jgi:hypothetical protein